MITQSLLSSTRFGEIQYQETDVVTFPEGIVGFGTAKRFLIIEHREGSDFRWLQSIDEPTLSFLVIDPACYIKDFSLEVRKEVVAAIEIDEETPQLVYTIVTIPKGKPQEMTLNLAGPLVINLANRKAIQLVLDDPRYRLKHRVFEPEQEQAA